MGNNRTGANQRIKRICNSKSLNETDLYGKAKLLLEVYRDACWNTADCADTLREEALCDYEICSNDLDAALLYLENFAPNERRARFEEKVQSLFDMRWMIEIVNHAIIRVHDFPITGELYCSILSACYLTSFPLTEKELLEHFGLERSTFYRRKREAIKVFGLALWGCSIREFRTFVIRQEGEQMRFYT